MTLPDAIATHFEEQARACAALGSPFTAALCRALPRALSGPLRAAVAGWPGHPGADALALRVTGAVQALARSGACPALSAAWPPGTGDLGAGLAAAMADHQPALLPWLASAPQTNEVARSGLLLGLALTVASRTGLPLELLEIGASAGLNLHFDRYAYDLGAAGRWGGPSPVALACDWQGRTPDLATPLRIVARAGSDLAPLDARDPAARARMLAYIWADQTARRARAEAALALAAEAPPVERAEAADWVEDRLARPQADGVARVLMHSIMWQYLPQGTKDRIRAALDRAGAAATAARPLAWARMEADGDKGSAALLLTLWPGGGSGTLGRGDFHGRWAAWDLPPAAH